MRKQILLFGLVGLVGLVGACTGRPAAPVKHTVADPTEPKLVTCNYDSDCFGGQGSCIDGQCSLKSGLSGARRSLDKPSPPPK